MTASDSSGLKIGGGVGVNSELESFKGSELYRFEISIGCNAKFSTFAYLLLQQGMVRGKFK